MQLNAVPLPTDKGFPKIIACGDSEKAIDYYYIQIENLVFPVNFLLWCIYFSIFYLHHFISRSLRFRNISISNKPLTCFSKYTKFSTNNLSHIYKKWWRLCNMSFISYQSRVSRSQIGWKRLPICSSDIDCYIFPFHWTDFFRFNTITVGYKSID